MKGENWEDGAETVMTELENFTICSVDESRDEEIRMAEIIPA